ncbi:MAG TPA: hypothetical protein VEX15_17750 [Nocardioidaceae bacterium]|nr:hypothetical protein [Nocardioidaceae bacterium]
MNSAGDSQVFDGRSGRPIQLPYDLTPVDVGPAGLLVIAQDRTPQLLERSEVVD